MVTKFYRSLHKKEKSNAVSSCQVFIEQNRIDFHVAWNSIQCIGSQHIADTCERDPHGLTICQIPSLKEHGCLQFQLSGHGN